MTALHCATSTLCNPAHHAKLLHCCAAPGYPKFQAVYDNISKDGAKLVLLLRLSPLVPFSLLNYGLGESSLSSRLSHSTVLVTRTIGPNHGLGECS
jgi:hypothetical protein